MGLKPNIPEKKYPFLTKQCNWCHLAKTGDFYSTTNSISSKDGYAQICNDCLRDATKNANWEEIDKWCQYFDIPFIPAEYEKLKTTNGDNTFIIYNQIFHSSDYIHVNWKKYWEIFKKLESEQLIEEELPLLKEEKFSRLREKWGANYSDEELNYLESLYKGILTSQNVNGALQVDQAEKLCKISLEIDSRIRAGADFDKILASYDKLVKVAEFTPKNAKNVSDFDSMGEVVLWLEKRGWRNKFYDNVSRDVVDETIKNIQASNQRLYVNESGIGDDITKRLESLKRAQETESYYDTDKEYDLEEYQDEVWSELEKLDGEFDADGNN